MARRKTKSPSNLSLVTADEVARAKSACIEFQRLNRARASAEKARDAAVAQLFFKMGFGSLAEVKQISPEKLARLIEERSGDVFDFESEAAAEFGILKTWEGVYVAWKDAFMERVGPQAAAELERSATASFAYAIVDRPEAPGPNVISIPPRKAVA